MSIAGQKINEIVINADADVVLADQFQNKVLRFRGRWWMFFAETVNLEARMRYISSVDGESWGEKADIVRDIGTASGSQFDIYWDGVDLSLVWADNISRSLNFIKGGEKNGRLVFGEEKRILWPAFAQAPTISKTNTGLTVVAFKEENTTNLSLIESNDDNTESWKKKVVVGQTLIPNSRVEGIGTPPDFGRFILFFVGEYDGSRTFLGIRQHNQVGSPEILSRSDLASSSNWDAAIHHRRYHIIYRRTITNEVVHTTGLIQDASRRNEVIHSKDPNGEVPLGLCLNEISGDVFDIWVWNGDLWIKKWDARSETWDVERLVAKGIDPASYRSFSISPRLSEDGLIGIAFTTGCVNNTKLNFLSINPDNFAILNPEVRGVPLTFESCMFPPTGWAQVIGIGGELERVRGISFTGVSSMRSKDPGGEGAYIRRISNLVEEPFTVTFAIRFVSFPISGRQFIWWYGGVKKFVRLAVSSKGRFRLEYSDGVIRSSEGVLDLDTNVWYRIRVEVPLPPGAVILSVNDRKDLAENTLVKLETGFEYIGNCGPGPSVKGSQFFIDDVRWTSTVVS